MVARCLFHTRPRVSEGNPVEPPSIPASLQSLADALSERSRREVVQAVEAARTAGVSHADVAALCVDHILDVGRGVLRGSRFGRTPEVLAASFTLRTHAGEAAGWCVLTAGADLLAASVPPAPSRSTPASTTRRWAARTEDWGRPALTAGAVGRLEAELGDRGLRAALLRSFDPPRRPAEHAVPSWIEPTTDGVVIAAMDLMRTVPGFREAAAVLVAREAWVDGSDEAVVAAAAFIEDTRRWAVRRNRLGKLNVAPAEEIDDGAFEDLLRSASTREAVHSFGVVHSLAAALAELRAGGSQAVAAAAGAVAISARSTQSPGRPPGATIAPCKCLS